MSGRSSHEMKSGDAWPGALRRVRELSACVHRSCSYYIAGHGHIPRPSVMTVGVTSRCNSRCVMCRIWEQQSYDLGSHLLRRLCQDPVSARIEAVVFSGGEPTLRTDLAPLVETVTGSLPRLREISLVTNGLNSEHVVEVVHDLLERSPVPVGVEVSLDGYGDVHDRIRRVPRAFERVSATLTRLQHLQQRRRFSLHVHCVIQRRNCDRLDQLAEFAYSQNLPITYGPVIRGLGNEAWFDQELSLTSAQEGVLQQFLQRERHRTLRWSDRLFWREYFRVISGGRRRMPCALPYHSLMLTPQGKVCISDGRCYGSVRERSLSELWYSREAERLRHSTRRGLCPTCTTSCNTVFSLKHDLLYLGSHLLQDALAREWPRGA